MNYIASLISASLDSAGPGVEAIGRLPRAIPRPRAVTLRDFVAVRAPEPLLWPTLFGKDAWGPNGTEAERCANGADASTGELYRAWAQAERTARRLGHPPGGYPGSWAAREIAILASAYESIWLIGGAK